MKSKNIVFLAIAALLGTSCGGQSYSSSAASAQSSEATPSAPASSEAISSSATPALAPSSSAAPASSEPAVSSEPVAPASSEASVESSEASVPAQSEESQESSAAVQQYQISVDPASLLGYSGITVTYGDGEVTINEVTFGYQEMSCYGNGLQMRHESKSKNNKSSSFWNSAALPGAIDSIDIIFNAGKNTYDNEKALKFSFGATSELGTDVYLNTVAGEKSYNVAAPGNATYLKMTINLAYSFYVDSFVINYHI